MVSYETCVDVALPVETLWKTSAAWILCVSVGAGFFFLLNVSMFYLFYASEQQIKQANIIFFVSLKWGYMGCDLAQH